MISQLEWRTSMLLWLSQKLHSNVGFHFAVFQFWIKLFGSTKKITVFLLLPFSASECVILHWRWFIVSPYAIKKCMEYIYLHGKRGIERMQRTRKRKQKKKTDGEKKKKSAVDQIIDNKYLQGHFPQMQSCQRVELEHLSEGILLWGLWPQCKTWHRVQRSCPGPGPGWLSHKDSHCFTL